MTLPVKIARQNVDFEKNSAPSKKGDTPVMCFTPTLPSKEIEDMMLKKISKDGNTQNMLAAGGLSAGIASQLLSTVTTNSPIAGGIAHTLLLVTCVTGLSTVTMHASPVHDFRAVLNMRGSTVAATSILAYLSLWFATIGIVVLAWAIQPTPVAVVVTVAFTLVVLAMAVRAVYAFIRIPDAGQNV